MTFIAFILSFIAGLVLGVYAMTQHDHRYWLKERSQMVNEIEKLKHEKKCWVDKWKNKYTDDEPENLNS